MLEFSVLAVPYAIVTLGLIALGVLVALLRGDLVVRIGYLMVVVTALPWSVSTMLGACLTDQGVVLNLYKAGYGPVPLIGSGLMIAMLAVAGRLDAYRPLVVATVVAGVGMMLVTASTDLVINGAGPTRSGFRFPMAGPLHFLPVTMFMAWTALSLWVSRRSMVWMRDFAQRHATLTLALGVLTLLTSTDLLVAYRVVDVYPFSWLPGSVAIGLSIWAIARGDLLRARGVDRAAAFELIALVAVTGLLVIITMGVDGDRRGPILVAVASLAAAALVVIGRSGARDTGPAPVTALAALDNFADQVGHAADPDQVARGLAELIEGQGLLTSLRVWEVHDGQARALRTSEAEPPAGELVLPDEVVTWLTEEPGTRAFADVVTERLGARRTIIARWARKLDCDVVSPLTERDRLVGLVAGDHVGPLRDTDRAIVDDATRAAARALSVLTLTRQVQARAEVTRELELAEAVRQARTAGDVRDLGGCRLAVSYVPASRVAGDLWSCTALPDDRLLVLIGDVAGRGLSAALVSAAVHGAAQVAAGLLGREATPDAVLGLLHANMIELDGGRHRVTAFAGLIDRRAGRIEFASAGHRGGYVLHDSPAGDGDGDLHLRALIGRGNALGESEHVIGRGSEPLGASDSVVLISDGVVEARDAGGRVWGERRLQRVLRGLRDTRCEAIGDVILAAVRDHAGDVLGDDDLLVVVVGAPGT